MLTFTSLFSGIGGFDLGFERAGLQCAAQVEIDKAARDVLRKRFPHAALMEDVRHAGKHNLPAVDVIAGGFPCQDVSVAGNRAGLAGSRSGLWFEFLRIVTELTPQWVVIENVPGLLSSNRGRDFAVILHGLVNVGYRVAWRVLDAQHFGLAQRRKRVFIVASLGDGRAAEILFERESGGGDIEPRRETGEGIAPAVIKGAAIGRKLEAGPQYAVLAGTLSASGAGTSRTGNARNEADMLILAADIQQITSLTNRSQPQPLSPTLSPGQQIVAIDVRNLRDNGNVSGTLQAKKTGGYSLNYTNPIVSIGGVRRLTPTECERLMGFPDDWTAQQPDSTRYRQLGNAVAVPVAEWIGRRIRESLS